MTKEGESRPRRKTPVVFKLGLLTFTVVLVLLTLEISVRLFSSSGTSLLVKDSIVGQRYLPGFDGPRFVAESGKTIHLRFNDEGFRGPNRPKEKPSGVRRVAVLGDSFIAAIAVDEPATLVAQLEQLLNERHSDERWEVLNFGVSGNGTGQELLTWRHFARHYAPDLVLLCFYNGNDLSDNHAGLSTAHRPYFGLNEAGDLWYRPLSPGRVSFSNWLADHSQLYVWQKHHLRLVRDQLREAGRKLPPGLEIFNTQPPDPFPEAWRLSEILLSTVAKEVEAAGARFAVVTIPAHEQVIASRWDSLLTIAGSSARKYDREHPEKRLSEICRKHGIYRIPLVETLRGVPDIESLYFRSEGHWTQRGNRIAANGVAARLGEISSAVKEAGRSSDQGRSGIR